MSRPQSTWDLSTRERSFVSAMSRMGFGRFEFLRIEKGELALNPWPTAVRDVKFGAQTSAPAMSLAAGFELKSQVADLFEYVRAVEEGEIRSLEIRHGLPFSMEIEHRPEGGSRG